MDPRDLAQLGAGVRPVKTVSPMVTQVEVIGQVPAPSADSCPIQPTNAQAVDARNIAGCAANTITFNVVNTTGETQYVVVGGIYGLEGAKALYDLTSLPSSAADVPGVTSDGEANVKTLQAFNGKTVANKVIIGAFEIIGNNAQGLTMIGKKPQLLKVAYDGTNSLVKATNVITSNQIDGSRFEMTAALGTAYYAFVFAVPALANIDINVELLSSETESYSAMV